MSGMRDVTITGNRYRAGLDDAGGGVLAPCSIYNFENVLNCKTIGNAGEYKLKGGSGGFADHSLYDAEILKRDSASDKVFDYVTGLAFDHTIDGSNINEVSDFSIDIPSSCQLEIDIFGTRFQKTLRSKIIVSKDDYANAIKVIDYGTVTVTASFSDDKTKLNITLSDKSWTKYSIKRFV